ncbi:MAG: hypothetical protein ND895_00880 [Pyrinomonadaceae bacterium]|nr:hypothetical protein [Pyrinomonadaceae bacterium]
MLDRLEFYGNDAKFNKTVFGAPADWVRWKGGVGVCAAYLRGYNDGRDFFAVLWQINTPRGDTQDPVLSRRVRLQVESPSYDVDSSLNDLKQEVINALLTSDLRGVVSESGFRYDDARTRTSDAQVKKNRTTTLFTVVLDSNQVKPTSEHTISVVHSLIAPSVNALFQPFSNRLKARFRR